MKIQRKPEESMFQLLIPLDMSDCLQACSLSSFHLILFPSCSCWFIWGSCYMLSILWFVFSLISNNDPGSLALCANKHWKWNIIFDLIKKNKKKMEHRKAREENKIRIEKFNKELLFLHSLALVAPKIQHAHWYSARSSLWLQWRHFKIKIFDSKC